MSIIFLGLMLFSQPAHILLDLHRDPYCKHLAELLSLDPEERVRAAWFIPYMSVRHDMSVRGENFSLAGERTNHLSYQLDGVPLRDPLNGENPVHLPRSLMAYGKLSHVEGRLAPSVQVLSRTNTQGWHTWLDISSPAFLDSATQGSAGLYFSIPLGTKFVLEADGEALYRQNRPRSDISLPRSDVMAYTGVISAELTPSPGMLVQARLLRSVEQRDRFSAAWVFNPSSSPTSFSLVDVLVFTFRYRKGIVNLEMTLSGYSSALVWGGRVDSMPGMFRIIPIVDTINTAARPDTRNPFGVAGLFYSQGSCPSYVFRSSLVDRAYLNASVLVGEQHMLRGRFEFSGANIFTESNSWFRDASHPAEYQYTPREGEFYAGDRIHWPGFWVEPGVAVLYFENEVLDTIGYQQTPLTLSLIPRVESRLSLGSLQVEMGTELDAAIPALSYYFDGKSSEAITDSLVIIPRGDPSPERAWRTWMSAEKMWQPSLWTGISCFFRAGYNLVESNLNEQASSDDSIPSAGVGNDGRSLAWGVSPWVEYGLDWFSVTAAYRFSSAKATSDGFYDSYGKLVAGDTASDAMVRLPLDSRHKFIVETRFESPATLPLLLQGWFIAPRFALASGFPDEVSDDGRTPWWGWCELSGGRILTLGPFGFELRAELTNPFGWTGPIIGSLPDPDLPGEGDFPDRLWLGDEDYHPARDANHDGYITAEEEVEAYARAYDYYQSWSPSPLPGRGIEVKFIFRF